MTDEKKQEFTLRISQANQSQLVVILYELFFYYTDEAENAYANGELSVFCKELQKAHDCLGELISSLNVNAEASQIQELAQSILQVYFFVSARIGAALGSRKKEPLEDAVRLMKKLYETYKADAANDTSAPVMGHAQTVYAGLTYGKNNLNVSCEDGSGSRGFYV
nr:flagellar protein FliS [Lachnospiraceae bacterium]